jgi:PilZ domain
MASLDCELRSNPRVSLFHEVVCESGHATARSEAADLSVGGMFIDLVSSPFLPSELVTVRFAVGPEFTPVVVEADVAYVQDGIGMGIRFLNLAPLDRERIADYVERTLHRPVLRGEFHLRKSARVAVTVPVVLRARSADGRDVEEPAQIITLSKHGACLLTRQPMALGKKLLLATPSGREFTSSIVWVGDSPSRSDGQVGIQCRGLAQSLGFRFP